MVSFDNPINGYMEVEDDEVYLGSFAFSPVFLSMRNSPPDNRELLYIKRAMNTFIDYL